MLKLVLLFCIPAVGIYISSNKKHGGKIFTKTVSESLNLSAFSRAG
jgi:hypothetical protein